MPEMVKAITLTDVGKAEIREYPKPTCGKGEVLIRTKAVALCTVDQRAFTGVTPIHFPAVQGHEGVGVVEAVGEGVNVIKVGDHVIMGRDLCGVCHFCKMNINQCATKNMKKKLLEEQAEEGKLFRPIGQFLSQMSQYMVAREDNVTRISKDVPFEKACLTEPISCVIHSVNRSRLSLGEIAVVIGAGIMGLLTIQIAKLKGATVIACEPDAKRRERAEKVGADFVINSAEVDPVTFVKEHSYGRGGADVVFNTVAISSVFTQGMEMLAPAGRIVAYSAQHPDTPVPIKMGVVHKKEYEIIGTLGSTTSEYYIATQLLERNMINTDLVIDYVFQMEDCQKAFEQAVVPGTYRVVIKLD